MTAIVQAPAITPEKQEEVLKYLGLNPNDTATHALVEVCNRYGFDPLLKHVVLIGNKSGKSTYVTRDGLLHLAHQAHQLDGLAVIEEGDNDKEWWAVVEVYRKDMSHPFRYRGRYPKSGSNKQYGPEMAVKCAEVMALRRAFDVSLPTVEEQWDTVASSMSATTFEEPAASAPPPPPPTPTKSPPPQPPSTKAAIEKARESLQPGTVVTKVKAGQGERTQIRSRMTAPGVTREMRDEFKDKFGPLDDLTHPDLDPALQWVKDRTSEVEPF